MFSQFRQAVENLAPLPRHSLDGSSADVQRGTVSRSNSLDSPSSPLSSSQLAESALVNLRKSLATQRSTGPRNGIATTRENKAKSTLEDRLRAAASPIAKASNGAPAEVSSKSLRTATIDRPLSPSSTPLPESPITSPKSGTITTPNSETITSPKTLTGTLLTDSPDPTPSQSLELVSSVPSPTVSTEGVPEDLPQTDLTETTGIPKPIHPSGGNPSNVSNNPADATDVEELRDRLKQVEQHLIDVSSSFKELQQEKSAAELVLRELTPLENFQDDLALRDYLQGMSSKAETLQNEITHLSSKVHAQDDRMNELQDMHRRELIAQSDQINKLKTQLTEADALIKAGEKADSQAEEIATSQKAEIDQLQKELEHAKLSAKEEEEKCVKAISLLKTVRQKLVKAEKEKEEALKEALSLKGRDKGEKDKEQAERIRLQREVDAANTEKEAAVADLKLQFDRDIASIKNQYEKEIAAIKGQFELEGTGMRNIHAQELAAKASHISSLEKSLNNVTKDKNVFFDNLQIRQAELESAQSHLESLQSQITELHYQLREADDRYALIKGDLAEVQHEQETRPREPAPSADEIARLLSATEAKYEAKVSDLKRNLGILERERNDSEAEWSRKLRDKTREAEELQRVVGSTVGLSEKHEEVVEGLKADIGKLEAEYRLLQGQLSELRQNNLKIRDTEKSWKAQELELNTRVGILEQQLDESKQKEMQLRLGNKTLREELRKVQSSAALLERQRNPGVGYWTTRVTDNISTESQTSLHSDPPSRVSSPRPASPAQSMNEEEVNLEYLRNVILQFLEHKEMRPNLVKVLSIILRFTPQETRRLIAKV